MRFELKIAWRHLISGGGQTILTICSVAIAAMVVLFVQITISGMQTSLMKSLLGSLPHVTVKPPDNLPSAMETVSPSKDLNRISISFQQPKIQQRTDIEQWKSLVPKLQGFHGVQYAVPNVSGSAFIIRGSKRRSVNISGGDPAEQEKITPLAGDLLAGRWLDINSGEAVIGVSLANEMRLVIGDKALLLSPQGVSRSFAIVGIFYIGGQADLNTIYLNLRAAQSLLSTGTNISTVQMKLKDPLQADRTASELSGILPYKVDSWMTEQGSFLNEINSQNAIKVFLTVCVLLASSVSVAAIMIVSVLQKNKQIGILKSMGAKDRQILAIFTLEGLGVAITGATLGLLGVYCSMSAMGSIKQVSPFGGKPTALFSLDFDPVMITQLMTTVILATVIASMWPARQAARLNPVEAIRG